VLSDTAPGREADYIMPGLARDTRHERVIPRKVAMYEYAG
jgi:hypothetical protein